MTSINLNQTLKKMKILKKIALDFPTKLQADVRNAISEQITHTQQVTAALVDSQKLMIKSKGKWQKRYYKPPSFDFFSDEQGFSLLMEKIPTMNETMKILLQQNAQSVEEIYQDHWKLALQLLDDCQTKQKELEISNEKFQQDFSTLSEEKFVLEDRNKTLEQQLGTAKLELAQLRKEHVVSSTPSKLESSKGLKVIEPEAVEVSKELKPREHVQILREKCGVDVKINPEMQYWVDNLQSTLQRY